MIKSSINDPLIAHHCFKVRHLDSAWKGFEYFTCKKLKLVQYYPYCTIQGETLVLSNDRSLNNVTIMQIVLRQFGHKPFLSSHVGKNILLQSSFNCITT